VAEDVAFEFLRRLQQAFANPVCLQMVPHEFIRIEFRGVRRQEEQLKVAVRRRYELLDRFRPVRGMLIDDEENRLRLIVQ
jgi:hypothetical protein